jgi:hypothetical protein
LVTTQKLEITVTVTYIGPTLARYYPMLAVTFKEYVPAFKLLLVNTMNCLRDVSKLNIELSIGDPFSKVTVYRKLSHHD